MRRRLHIRAEGLVLLCLGLGLVGVGYATGQAVLVLWGAVPLGLLGVERLRAVRLVRRVTGRGALASMTLAWPDSQGQELTAPAGVPLRTELTISVAAPQEAIHGLCLRPVGSHALAFWPDGIEVNRGRQDVSFSIVARRVGVWRMLGVLLSAETPLRAFAVSGYRPIELTVRALPRASAARAAPLPAPAGAKEGLYLSPVQRRGYGSELRELRDHVPGDPFKHIAWKATARARRLIVREFEPDLSLSIYLLMDLAPSMRVGEPGAAPLDRAVELASGLARHLGRSRDRVGYVAFGSRVVSFQRAGNGAKATKAVLRHLLDVHQLPHEELTGITDGELLLRVGDFLARQEPALRTRLGYAAGDHWGVPDPEALHRHVREWLGGRRANAWGLASEETAAELRLFCKERGIELPFRPPHTASRRARGLQDALERVLRGGGGPHLLVLFSDLADVESPDTAVRAIRRARAHRCAVLVILVGEGAFGSESEAPRAAERLDEVLKDLYREEEVHRRAALCRELKHAGAEIVRFSAGQPFPSVIERIRRALR